MRISCIQDMLLGSRDLFSPRLMKAKSARRPVSAPDQTTAPVTNAARAVKISSNRNIFEEELLTRGAGGGMGEIRRRLESRKSGLERIFHLLASLADRRRLTRHA